MTVEQARAKLGDLVIAAMRGETTVITRYGKPAAMITPFSQEPAMTITLTDVRDQVSRFLSESQHGDDFDADAIAETIRDRHGLIDIDDLEPEEFNAILAEHDTTA